MNSALIFVATLLAVAQAGVITQGIITHDIIAPAIRSTQIVGPGTSTDVHGPDGAHIHADNPGGVVDIAEHVAVAHHVAAPVVVAHSLPLVHSPLVHSPLIGVVPEGHGLEGQYVPDNLEHLYDDGSYHGDH